VIRDSITPEARLIVTGGKTESLRQCKQLLRTVFPHAHVRNAGFSFVFVIESAGDPLALAADVEHKVMTSLGHITPVHAKIDTSMDAILETAVKIAIQHIGADETFCFRIHKRGSHGLVEDTPTLECEIGTAIWRAIEQKYGKKP
jgi:tRNA(Ser,Leu) C12 N-acetylase TAN1